MFKLWERKGKCYFGLKRYELAAKCIRQSLNALKESGLSDPARAHKSSELQGLLKEWRNAQELSQIGEKGAGGGASGSGGAGAPLMGATGPLVLIPDTNTTSLSRKTSEAPAPAPTPTPKTSDASLTAPGQPQPPRPDRRSVRKKVSSPQPPTNGEEQAGGGILHKADSKMSISQISMGGVPASMRGDVEVPELSYGINNRMPSASIGIDLRFAPDRGRFFVATQDLLPGEPPIFYKDVSQRQNMKESLTRNMAIYGTREKNKMLTVLAPLG